MNTAEADVQFLRRILFGLIVGTLATGSMAAIATVNAGPYGSLATFLQNF